MAASNEKGIFFVILLWFMRSLAIWVDHDPGISSRLSLFARRLDP